MEFLGHITRKVDLEKLTLTRHIEGMKDRGKQRVCLIEWMAEQGLEVMAKRKSFCSWRQNKEEGMM